MPFIFVSGHGDVPAAVQAMKAGAFEFLTKPIRSPELLNAIRDAIDLSTVGLRQHAATRRLESSYASLTARQREVMKLIAAGLLNKQIAGELGISEITVKAHRGRLMRKMNAGSLAALVMMAATLGQSKRGRHESQ